MKHLPAAALRFLSIALCAVPALLGGAAVSAQTGGDAPRFTADNQLVRPVDFREWMFVTSGLGMTYNTPATANPSPNFTNVYVNPSSYRAFMKTGRWPDQTTFVLEIRSSASEGSINKGGNYQTALVAVEASVKDAKRFPGGWGYFNFGRGADLKNQVEVLPATATCYACHSTNTAVDNTFVQFYPTLLDVARRMGTVRPAFADVPAASH